MLVDGAGLFEQQPGSGNEWRSIADVQLSSRLESDIAQRRTFSRALGAEITALASSGDALYAGGLDGRIWVSLDRGQTWNNYRAASGSSVEGIFVDGQESRIALAVLGGKGAPMFFAASIRASPGMTYRAICPMFRLMRSRSTGRRERFMWLPIAACTLPPPIWIVPARLPIGRCFPALSPARRQLT